MPLPDSWHTWLTSVFPEYFRYAFAPYQVDFWAWLWKIERGKRPAPFIGIWPRGAGKCLHADTELVCADGQRRKIRDIEIGQSTLSLNEHTGKIEKDTIVGKWDSGIKHCIQLQTQARKILVLTPEHKVLTFHGWKMASDLTLHDRIASPRRIPSETTEESRKDEEGRRLASMFMEGGTSGEGNTHACHFTHADVFWDKMVSLDDAGAYQTYDIEIEKNHNVISNGLITHNSTNAEMACVLLGMHRIRRYGLYISSIQAQADDHVQNVASLFEHPRINVQRLVGKYGHSRGWRRDRMRTQDGFTLDAIGLDTAARGVKLEEDRPDFMVIDDIDSENDTEYAIQKKIRSLTRKLLPAGADDLAVIGMQNLIHDQGIFARLEDGRADFLSDRIVSGPFPALRDLRYQGEGMDATITGGTPLWEGLSLEKCQEIVRNEGLEAFLAERQQQRHTLQGTMFGDVWSETLHIVEPFDVPRHWPIYRAFDWGSSAPFSCGWWAEADGETRIRDVLYPRGTLCRVMEFYGWNGKKNQGLRLTNSEIGRRIKDREDHSLYRGRIRPGPADSQIFDVIDGRTIAQELEAYGIRFQAANKGPGSRRQGWQAIRDRLKAMHDRPIERPGLIVFSTCPQWIRTVPILRKDLADPDDIQDGEEDHAADETRYVLLSLRYGPATRMGVAT